MYLMDCNKSVYRKPEVVKIYSELDGLDDSEKIFAETFIRPGSSILDLGVGCGRTTRDLSSRANYYVGVDYSEEMIKECVKKFPDKKFLTLDASSLNVFKDESFDIVVFSFNGIDYLPNDESRLSCLSECSRVLRQNGFLFFSSHNARHIFFEPVFSGKRIHQIIREALKCLYKSVRSSIRFLMSDAFYSGHGYLEDPTHGGLWTHVSMPEFVLEEARACGFEKVMVMSKTGRPWLTLVNPWYYYVFQKSLPV